MVVLPSDVLQAVKGLLGKYPFDILHDKTRGNGWAVPLLSLFGFHGLHFFERSRPHYFFADAPK